MESLSLAQARRLALGAQGFARRRPRGRVDVRHLRRLVDELALLQLDYVNVLVPSHYLVPFSRLGPYEPRRLDDLAYRRREVIEQWAHEASLVPAASWPLLAHRRRGYQPRPRSFAPFLASNPEYVARVLEVVRDAGPLLPEDLPWPEDGSRKLEHSWFGSVRKATLEHHFGLGRVAVAGRLGNFARVYDLAERVVAAEHLGREIADEDAHRELVRRAARAHGVATAGDLADYFRMPAVEAKPAVEALAAAGELLPVAVEGWRETAYLDPAAAVPRRIRAAALLSPFDPVVWTRRRALRLFGFDYRFEIFVPREQRRWGAYVLPFLLGERLVARVDVKADRPGRRLQVLGAWREAHAAAVAVAPPLAVELATLAGWLGLGEVTVSRRGDLAAVLAAEVGAGGEA
jgi:uncharacterized protein YcaQ